MDTITGLPAHPLMVHLPVVLVPLAALGALVLALRPRWQPTFGPLLAAVTGLGLVGTLLASSSGEALEERLEDAGRRITGALEEHVEAGEGAAVVVGVFFALVLAWVVTGWWMRRQQAAAAVPVPAPAAADATGSGADRGAVARPRGLRLAVLALSVAAVLSGVAATAVVTNAGHTGATSVWENLP